MTSNGKKYYLHYDQVGTLKAVSNAHQKIIKKITYDTYGNIRNETNEAFKVPFGFAGGLYDHDTKLTRFGYRDYDATTGKWTAKDPIDFGGGDSNLYGYVLQDPVNFTDASGLFFDTLDNPVMIPFYVVVGIYVFADYTADALITVGRLIGDSVVNMASRGNVADSAIIQSLQREGTGGKNRCEWLKENSHRWSKSQVKAWGCRHSRASKDKCKK